MADHDVFITLPERQLGRADAEFRIKRNSKAFGKLRVSEGGLEWVPANKQSGIKIGWMQLENFADGKK
jgi:hypothetical protein